MSARRSTVDTKPAEFGLAEVTALEQRHAEEITRFRTAREAAFTAERDRWQA
jgi:urea carboxylase